MSVGKSILEARMDENKQRSVAHERPQSSTVGLHVMLVSISRKGTCGSVLPMTKKEKWIWMPHHGHFICGSRCRFHLNTYIGNYIVSTVGEMMKDFKDGFDFEDIGHGRKYETMVFEAVKEDKEVKCCPFRQSGDCLDMEGYNDPNSAYEGHLRLCKKWAKKSSKKKVTT